MLLRAIVLSGDVQESVFYDQGTGAPKPGFTVVLKVLDADTDETYECQLTEGFQSLDALKELRRQGQGIDVMRQAADQLRAELPAKMSELHLEVVKLKGKSAAFLKLVCRPVQMATA